MKNFKKLIGDKIYLSPKGTTDEEIEIFTQWVNDFQVTDYIGVKFFMKSPFWSFAWNFYWRSRI